MRELHLKTPQEYYCKLNRQHPGKIIKFFRKANVNFKYDHVLYLVNLYCDILKNTPYYAKLMDFQFVVMKCRRLNQFSWQNLSKYEQRMFCVVLDYDLLKHIWNKKLVTLDDLWKMTCNIDFNGKESMARYLHTVVQLHHYKLDNLRNYMRHLNEFDLYFIIHCMVRKIDNDLMDSRAIKYYIYSLIISNRQADKHVNESYYSDDDDNDDDSGDDSDDDNLPYNALNIINNYYIGDVFANIIAIGPQDLVLEKVGALCEARRNAILN